MYTDSPSVSVANRPASTAHLSRRELEVLIRSVGGKPSQELADDLFLSRRTVEWHLGNAYAKLGVRTRLQAIRRARRLGLLSAEPANLPIFDSFA